MTAEQPRRRWFRYSLRTLFVVMTLAAIASLVVPPTIAWMLPPDETVRVNLPKSNPPISLSPIEHLPIDIILKRDARGQVAMYMGDRSVDEARLRRLFDSFPDLKDEVLLSVDKGIPDDQVAKVVKGLADLGVKNVTRRADPANGQ